MASVSSWILTCELRLNPRQTTMERRAVKCMTFLNNFKLFPGCRTWDWKTSFWGRPSSKLERRRKRPPIKVSQFLTISPANFPTKREQSYTQILNAFKGLQVFQVNYPAFLLGLKNLGLFASLPSQKSEIGLGSITKSKSVAQTNWLDELAVNCLANKGPKNWIRKNFFCHLRQQIFPNNILICIPSQIPSRRRDRAHSIV